MWLFKLVSVWVCWLQVDFWLVTGHFHANVPLVHSLLVAVFHFVSCRRLSGHTYIFFRSFQLSNQSCLDFSHPSHFLQVPWGGGGTDAFPGQSRDAVSSLWGLRPVGHNLNVVEGFQTATDSRSQEISGRVSHGWQVFGEEPNKKRFRTPFLSPKHKECVMLPGFTGAQLWSQGWLWGYSARVPCGHGTSHRSPVGSSPKKMTWDHSPIGPPPAEELKKEPVCFRWRSEAGVPLAQTPVKELCSLGTCKLIIG